MDLFKSSLTLLALFLFTRSSHQDLVPERSYELSMISRVNQTGHCAIDFALVQESRGFRRNWRANFKHEVYEEGGLEKHYVAGKFLVPPPKPKDYELSPGIGFYKFHSESKTFHDGMVICSREGGHLLIVNSQVEANVIKALYARHPDAWEWANIGFHDQDGDGYYHTIFGKSLESTGYNAWYPNEPDHSYGPAHCGVIQRNGLLGGGVCKKERPFICEYDLSWDN